MAACAYEARVLNSANLSMKNILLLSIALFFCSCIARESASYSVKHFEPSDDKVRITGRVQENDSVTIFWPGTSIKVRFQGQALKAYLRDEKGTNFFNVVIDGDSLHYMKLDTTKRFYTLAENLPDGEHTIELIKRSEWDKGKTWFYGMQVTKGDLLDLPPPPKRVIEFFGNSITAGYAIDDTTGKDSPEGPFTNNYYTYAATTARHFNADYYCTVKSGIGIMISWFPMIMPELYGRLDPTDSLSKWDFSKVQPQVVVINLFQNDSWLVNIPEHESFKRTFGKIPPSGSQIIAAYKNFVSGIRKVYPDAHIICALGSMDATRSGSPWPGYVDRAVGQLNDAKIHTLFFPFTGKPGHPDRKANAEMAKVLIEFIENKVGWK
jgi:hypothetical protein